MRFGLFYIFIIGIAWVGYATNINDTIFPKDSISNKCYFAKPPADTIIKLDETDYQRVADDLGIEVATIKSVVDVEAGISHNGFVEPGKPLVNFDLNIFKRLLRKKGLNFKKHQSKEAFKKPNIRKYGSYGKAQWARYKSACEIDSITATEASFWGMFQIGGFNWKKCGCSSISEFIYKMSESEKAQLDLFSQFCISSNLTKHLKNRDWNIFAYKYNGPSYKSRGFHNKLRAAYKKHKNL